MNKNELKKKYFEQGAAALRNIGAIDQEFYCCPICTQLFIAEAIDEGILTLEHAPPKKVGGKPLALTCKECNSAAGYSVDSAVVQRQRQIDFTQAITGQKSNYKGRATFSIGENTLNIGFERDQGITSIKPIEGINDPNKLRAYQDFMMYLQQAGKWDGQKFTITPNAKYHIKYSKIGDLKAAFIICFAFFGYRFALHNRLAAVREQIINYKEDIINHYWHISDPKVNREHFLFLVKKPFSALAVKLGNSTVLLPWVTGPDNFYEYLGEYFFNREPVNFDGLFFNWPESLEMRLDSVNTQTQH